ERLYRLAVRHVPGAAHRALDCMEGASAVGETLLAWAGSRLARGCAAPGDWDGGVPFVGFARALPHAGRGAAGVRAAAAPRDPGLFVGPDTGFYTIGAAPHLGQSRCRANYRHSALPSLEEPLR